MKRAITQSGRREREVRRSKMRGFGIFLARRLGLSTAAYSGLGEQVLRFPLFLPNPGLSRSRAAPLSRAVVVGGKRSGPTRRLVKHQNVEFGRRDNKAEVGPKESLTVTLDSGHGELAGTTPAQFALKLFDCSALLGGRQLLPRPNMRRKG